ncbi:MULTISPECIES: hypothetical protein [Paenibacillus]|uniref:hypothetical protein n=1 Tax=Paenibacillus TaxID=44249 RepID=UPI0011A449BD|nr:hypothetical protein [Paenibacillus sp. IHBB 10380]
MDEITYTRKLNTFQGGSGDAIIMTVFYRGDDGESNYYFVDIRELGIIISNKKEYKMDGDSTELINKLVNWIMSNGSILEDGTDRCRLTQKYPSKKSLFYRVSFCL